MRPPVNPVAVCFIYSDDRKIISAVFLHPASLVFLQKVQALSAETRLQAVKNASISNSILITNAIPAEGIPNCVNKMV